MNFTRRRGAIAFSITLGILLIGLAVALNVGWILLNTRRIAIDVLGIILFSALIAGVVLNTTFLVREVRRNERQDSFLNAVTHELKTPIASIRLYLETLQRREVSPEQQQEFYSLMLSDTDRLRGTVEQVLRAGQLGQRLRQQQRALLNLEHLLHECIETTRQRQNLPEGSIVLEPVPGAARLEVSGIAEDLRTAFLNVLDNAVKYSPDRVEVHCSLRIERYTMAAVRISDMGLGLPEGQEKLIFKRFYRVPGRSMVRIKGTGLGLFLVRAIARQHGGDASASSRGLGQGTTVTITLPLARSER